MADRRVLIIADGRLLSEAVTRLMRATPNIDLMTIDAQDPKVLDRVKEAHADVIILPSYNTATSLLKVGQILKDNPGARVISFGLDNTEINVYQSSPAARASLEELFAAIEGGP